MTCLLSAQQLGAQRGNRWLYQNISLEVESGQLIYLEGPNGAGKTTLLRQLAGLTWLDQGHIERYSGIAYLGHRNGIQRALTPLQNLQWTAQLFAIEAPTLIVLLREWDLLPYKDTPCLALSAGQCRRVALACLSLQRAPLCFLDEPFTTLDYSGSTMLCARIQSYRQAGGAVIMTSHQTHPLTPDLIIHVNAKGGRTCA